MADNVLVDNGALTDYQVSADEAAGGQVQRIKVAYSADGSETHVLADVNGLLVQIASLPAVALDAGTLAALETIQVGSLPIVTLDAATLAALETINAAQSGTWTVTANHGITGIFDGRKVIATAGTRETLAASTACKRVVLTAETDNTGLVVVGGTTVVAALATRRGTPLSAGDSMELEIDNLADVNLDVTVNGDGVTYTYFT